MATRDSQIGCEHTAGARSDTRTTSNDGKSIFRTITTDSISLYSIQLQLQWPGAVIVIELRRSYSSRIDRIANQSIRRQGIAV